MKTKTLFLDLITCRVAQHPSRQGQGFTLIELLVTVAIIGILATLAAPSYSEFVAKQRVKTASFDVLSTLVLARSEALKRNTNVTVSPTDDDWANGWAITVGGTVLHEQSAFRNLTITGPASLSYTSNGRLAAAVDDFEISNAGTTALRCINIDLSGRPNSKAEAC